MSDNNDIFDFDVDVFEDIEKSAEPQEIPKTPEKDRHEGEGEKKQGISESQVISHSNKPSQSKKHTNKFGLTDEQKINLSKRLPKGFTLLKKGDFPQSIMINGLPFKGQIEYIPVKRQQKIASEELLEKFPIALLSVLNPKREVQRKTQKLGLRLSGSQLPEGKSKQTEKVKGVFQRLRKHPKYQTLLSHLNKLGLGSGFNEIETEIKKNIHTIDSFKERCLYLLKQSQKATWSENINQAINQLTEQLSFQVEQAKKFQFQSNLALVQKQCDKLTRDITDIKDGGNAYLRKKKRNERSFDEKEVMYIADLAKQLPLAYQIGCWQIVQQKPFIESSEKQLQINFSQLKAKKIREIEAYIKRKFYTLCKSRQRKKQKMMRKRLQKQQKKQIENKKEFLDDLLDQQFQQKKQDNIGYGNQLNRSHILEPREQFLQLDDLIDFNAEPLLQDSIQPINKQRQNEEIIDEDIEFKMDKLKLIIPQDQFDGDSSDSSFITDDQQSD